MKTTLVMRISYNDVFEKTVSKSKLLEAINTEHALEMLVLINKTEHIIKKSSQTELKFILNEWLINSNPEFKQSIIDCYLKLLKSNNLQFSKEFTEICIINRIGTLRAIEILLSQNNIKKNENIEEQLSMDNLLKLYLIVNDEIAERQDVFFRRYRNGMDDKANEIRFHLFLGLSNADLTPKSLSKKLMAEVYKFALFEKWMKHRIKSKDVENEFFEKVSSTDWYNFFSKIFQINNISINNYIISNKIYPELSVVLNYFSNHKQTDLEWNELTWLYKKPLHKNPNGDYLILDSEFMMNKFFSGTYHDLIEISKLHDKNFHLDYSKEFVEEGLFVKALKITFGKSYVQFSEKDIKKEYCKGIENLALPDFYMRNGNKVFLFECKNSYISHVSKITMDCVTVEEDVKNKFLESNGKKKAIKQIVSFISNCNEGRYTFFDKSLKVFNAQYYPVLVVTDETITSMGFNQLFNEYFDEEIDKDLLSIKKRIKPLTVIHINDLLYYSSLLQKLHIVIDGYHHYIDKKIAIDAMMSFSTYLETERFVGKKNFSKKTFDDYLKDSFLGE